MASPELAPKDSAPGGKDRRVHLHLRRIFDDACRITAPFFDPQQQWSNAHLTLFAHQALRLAYPDLTPQDIALLFSGVQSFHVSRAKKRISVPEQ